jgi:hypothetical protein
MTGDDATQPLTARVFLFGRHDNGERLTQALGEQGVGSFLSGLQGLSREGLAAVRAEVAAVVQKLMDADLGDLVVGGWRTQADLIAAAKRTIKEPNTSAVVDLVKHTVTSSHNSSIDILVEDVRVASVALELSAEFGMKGLAATVRHGRLVAISGGSCDVKVTLSAEGRQLGARQDRVPLQLIIRLGEHGLALLPDQEGEDAEKTASSGVHSGI